MRARGWSGGVEADLDSDGVGDVGQVAGVAGDDGGLVADGGGVDDGVDDVGGAGGGAGESGGAADAGVVGEDVAAFEDAGDLVLRAAAAQAWAKTTTGTMGRMRAAVSSSCRARKSGLRRSAASRAPVS